jgi:hypothetical protein
MVLLTVTEQARIEGVVVDWWHARPARHRLIGYKELLDLAEAVWREAVSASQRDDTPTHS